MRWNLAPAGAALLLGGTLVCGCAARSDDKAETTSNGTVASAESLPTKSTDTVQAVTHLSSAAPVELGDKPVRVTLNAPGEGNALGTRLQRLASGHRLYLVLSDVRAESQPGTLFHLYLDVPSGSTPMPNDSRHIGSVNFYDAIRDRGTAHADDASRLRRSFDITDTVRKLKDAQLLTEATSVTIMPSRPPEAGAKAMIGRIEIVEQSL